MNDEELRSAYRRSARATSPGAHLEPEELERIINGSGSETDRLALLEHALQCRSCGAELDLLRAANEGARSAEHRMPSTRWLAVAAAALILIGVGSLALRGRHSTTSADVLRGHGSSLLVLEPASGASVENPLRVVWNAVDGASSYRIELIRQNGDLVGAWNTSDTTLALGDSVRIDRNASYDVWIRATLTDRTEISSPMVRFNVK